MDPMKKIGDVLAHQFRYREDSISTLSEDKVSSLRVEVSDNIKSRHKRTWDEEITHLSLEDSFHVLVVDDFKTQSDLVSNLLTSYQNVTVEVADDGDVAVRMVRKRMDEGKVFHLILIDICMPHNGYEATKDIRRLERERNTLPVHHIIGITAEGISFKTDAKARECGMDDTVSKPLTKVAIERFIAKRCQELSIDFEVVPH